MPGDQICSACTRSFPRNHYVGVGGRRCTRCAACRRTVPAPLLSVATPAPATFPAPSSPPAAPAPAPLTTPSTSAPAPAQPNSAAPSIWDASALPPPSTVDTSAHSRLDEQADTITQLAESVAEIRQLVLSLRQDLAQPAAVPSLPAAPAIPPPTVRPHPPVLPTGSPAVVLPAGTRRPAVHPPLSFASSLGISASAATLLWNGLATSTRDRAGSTVAAYRTFCAFEFGSNVACFPASGRHLLEWLGSMSTAGRSYHSAKHELSHLRSHHVDLGLSLHGFECGRLERALRGYKRIHGARRTGAKLPITLPLLRRLVLALDTFADLSTWDRAVFAAAFTLSFACFLRSGEVVWDRSSDPGTILRVASVELAADHAIVTLPASKTDPFSLGVKVVAPLVGGPECPVARLRTLTTKRAALAPLFGLGRSGTEPLTRSAFVATLRRAIAWAGLEPAAYAGHSFRRGAATWAARLGASPDTIQCLGRWNSDCFRRYVDRSATERRDLSVSALFTVRDGPLVPDSTSWRDVGAV